MLYYLHVPDNFSGFPEESLSNDNEKARSPRSCIVQSHVIFTFHFQSIHSKQAQFLIIIGILVVKWSARSILKQECLFPPISNDRPLSLEGMPKTITYFKAKPTVWTINVRLFQRFTPKFETV